MLYIDYKLDIQQKDNQKKYGNQYQTHKILIEKRLQNKQYLLHYQSLKMSMKFLALFKHLCKLIYLWNYCLYQKKQSYIIVNLDNIRNYNICYLSQLLNLIQVELWIISKDQIIMMDLLSLLLQLNINYLKKLLKFIENRTFVKKLWLSYYKIFKI